MLFMNHETLINFVSQFVTSQFKNKMLDLLFHLETSPTKLAIKL